MKKIFYLLAVAAFMAACGQAKQSDNAVSPADSVTIEKCQFETGDSVLTCTLKGKPYTGSVWSNDVKGSRMTFKDGNMTAIEYYHSNGKVAIRIQYDRGSEKPVFFDPEGKEVNEQTFAVLYTDSIEAAVLQYREEIYQKMKKGVEPTDSVK